MSGDEEVIWHEVECSRYVADLALWAELGSQAAGPVLELGCGSGRVALDLAGRDLSVTGLDRSAPLIAELGRRAARRGLVVEGVVGDACGIDLEQRFGAILAPMQFVHLLSGPSRRRRMLDRVAALLRPGGTFAAAVLAEDLPTAQPDRVAVLPDVAEHDGWVYSSIPVEVAAAGDGFELRRLRQVVSPAGEMREEIDTVHLHALSPQGLEAEAQVAGLTARERIEVPPTEDHVGSVVCVLEAP
jgi:SAM-dependent methyltransferase